jgi:hypothetical protein
MDRAEIRARERGCHSAWLDTFSFQARGFYEKLGYEEFGRLDCPPPPAFYAEAADPVGIVPNPRLASDRCSVSSGQVLS